MMMRKLQTMCMLALLLVLASPVAAFSGEEISAVRQQDYFKHTGNIGPYAITFFFNPTASGKYVGYYYYNDRPHSHFSLYRQKEETINARGSVRYVLYEKSPAGIRTGIFRGQYESSTGYFSGVFTNSKGQKFKFEICQEF